MKPLVTWLLVASLFVGLMVLTLVVSMRQSGLATGEFVVLSKFGSLIKGGPSSPKPQPNLVGRNLPGELAEVPLEPSTATGREQYNALYIIRGSLLGLDLATGVLELERIAGRVDKPQAVQLDISHIDTIQCWPEVVVSDDGGMTFLRDAYIAFVPYQSLSWSEESEKKLAEVAPFFDMTTYFFARLADQYLPDRTNQVVQLVVLGC